MEKFLEELRHALEEAKVENSEEIVAEYLEHFSVGHEAGMTDEEIIERFDKIEDIVFNASKKSENTTKYDVILDLEYFSDFEIVQKSKVSGIQFEVDEKALEYITIIRQEGKIHLKNKKHDPFHKNKHFEGTMYVGKDVQFNQFTINNINCDISCNFNTVCSGFSLENINGDVKGFDVVAEESILINNTNGDLDFSRLEAPTIKINNVSGDIEIDELTADLMKVSTVSGDIKILHCNESSDCQFNTVSGDIQIKDGAEDSKVKVSTVSGEVKFNGKVVSKSISEIIKNSFKW